MATRSCFLLLAVVFFATTASAARWNAPTGSIVAVADFKPAANTSTGKAKATLIIPPVGNASIAVNLTGSLEQVWGAHIHLNTTGAPILVGLLPSYAPSSGSDVIKLNPVFSYKGSFNFIVTFAVPSRTTFLSNLKAGKLFVNVHTNAQPGGAIQGTLICKVGC